MGVYKTKSVYKAPSVYRSGIYKNPSDVVLLNGVRYENRFYEIDSNNVGSTFVDAVRLPEGYEKLGRVWYNGDYGESYSSLISTDFQIPVKFGTVYLGAYTEYSYNNNNRIFTNSFTITTARYVRVIAKADMNYVVTINSNQAGKVSFPITSSCALRDDNKFRKSLVTDDTWYNGGKQEGTYDDRHLTLLSSRGRTKFRFLFFVNSNRQVTFAAIPCKHDSDYGLYDVVAGKFYAHAYLTGD